MTTILFILIYILSLSFNVLTYDKLGVYCRPVYEKDQKIFTVLFFLPFINTFFAIISMAVTIPEIIKKIKFEK